MKNSSDSKISKETHATFDEFWPDYVKAHQSPVNQALHFIATLYELTLIVLGFVYSFWFWALLPLGYLFAWTGHYFFEKNEPLTFVRVRWSFRADHFMFFYILTGRWQKEQRRLAELERQKSQGSSNSASEKMGTVTPIDRSQKAPQPSL